MTYHADPETGCGLLIAGAVLVALVIVVAYLMLR